QWHTGSGFACRPPHSRLACRELDKGILVEIGASPLQKIRSLHPIDLLDQPDVLIHRQVMHRYGPYLVCVCKGRGEIALKTYDAMTSRHFEFFRRYGFGRYPVKFLATFGKSHIGVLAIDVGANEQIAVALHDVNRRVDAVG